MAEDIQDYRAAIADNVRKLRADKGWTQSQLVAATAVAQTTISNIERFGKPFSLDVAYKLAHAFGVTVHELLPPKSDDVVADLRASMPRI